MPQLDFTMWFMKLLMNWVFLKFIFSSLKCHLTTKIMKPSLMMKQNNNFFKWKW